MNAARVHVIRKLVPHYLNPSTANVARMTVEQLQQFIAGSFMPTEDQLTLLARRIKLEDT